MGQCKWFIVCPMKKFFEQGKIEEYWIKEYCKNNWKKCVRFQMEENGEYHPDWMLPDGSFQDNLKAK